MIDLVEFLRPRLAEDAEIERMIVDGDYWHGIHVDSATEVAVHIERFNPARMLREVEAKRQIIDELVAAMAEDFAPWNEKVLRLLALPYADHPDYREEWRP